MANWNLLVENYFSKKDILTLDKIDDLVLEVLKESTTLYESNRGVAHQSKMGAVITDESGNKLMLSSFSFLEVGDRSEVELELKDDNGEPVLKVGDEIKDTKTLVAVTDELTKDSEVLYRHPEKLTNAVKAVIIVFAEDGKKSFIKYTKNSPFWQEKDLVILLTCMVKPVSTLPAPPWR